MKRSLKIFTLLIMSLFVVVSGVNSALDCLSRSVSQSNCTVYNEKGEAVATYTGDLRVSRPYVKPEPVGLIHLVHRS